MSTMTKSPVKLARLAYKIAKKGMTPYSSQYSRKDFTQHQLFTILILRQFFKTDYRGIMVLMSDWSDVRKVLKLKKVPHWTTLQKAEQRLLKKRFSIDCSELSLPTLKLAG